MDELFSQIFLRLILEITFRIRRHSTYYTLEGQFSLSRVTQNASTSYGIAPIELQIGTQRQFLTTETMGVGYCMLIFSRGFWKFRFSEE